MNLPNPLNTRALTLWLLLACACACAATLAAAGCNSAPGKPGLGPDSKATRPEQVLDFPTLYAQNCASCHGVNGRNGAAISLANPVYLATAGVTNLQRVTAVGVPSTAMPPFARSSGGMLTDRQIAVLAQQIVALWGNPAALAGQTPPAYASSTPGDPTRGQQAFTNLCAHCHGADATGGHADNGVTTGSLVDPAYLALISDQALRSLIISGQPEQGMPDWRHHLTGPAARPAVHTMSEQEIADTVAWLTSHRIATPGQPYQPHP
jgi:cytochrome c oxidase cbb3-type subunit 3/ubiquinol-cytochrome c reductase cytochrome c subunit